MQHLNLPTIWSDKAQDQYWHKINTDTLWQRVQTANLKWILHCRFVNDNTALAVFANPAAASEALSRAKSGQHKVRPFSEVCQIGVDCAAALI